MKTLLFSFCLVVGAFSLALNSNFLKGEQMREYLNANQKYFKARMPHFTEEELKARAMKKEYMNHDSLNVKIKQHKTIEDYFISSSFGATTQWSQCASIGTVRQQSECSSCWAFAAAEIMIDRSCTKSNGANKPTLSPEDILDYCSTQLNPYRNCDGGYPAQALNYFYWYGVVIGAIAEAYRLPAKDVASIQIEILNQSPVLNCFDLYSDFDYYQSGVYVHTSSSYVGDHCVKIIGWGTDNGMPYWLAANSWGNDWGENGLFKLIRDINKCNFEEWVYAANPK